MEQRVPDTALPPVGMDNAESGQRYLDGWALTHNFFREHEASKDRTPADEAKIELPLKEWTDVRRYDREPVRLRQPRPAIKASTPVDIRVGTPSDTSSRGNDTRLSCLVPDCQRQASFAPAPRKPNRHPWATPCETRYFVKRGSKP